MDIVVASNNKGKIREIREIFSQYNIISMKDAGINIDIEETGETFLENALIKAKTIYELLHVHVLSDDSGLMVDALGGEPGVRSARYSGKTENVDAHNNALLIKNLADKNDRRAKFVSAVVLYYGEDKLNNPSSKSPSFSSKSSHPYIYAIGETYGEILLEPRGNEGFGYDPLFYSHELEKTFAEATLQEKNKVSHRAKALRSLSEAMKRFEY